VPTTLEAALVLLILLAPGFIAVRVKNSLLPYRVPSAFQETVEAAILSVFLLPAWLAFGWRFIKARRDLILTSQTLQPLDPWVFAPVIGAIAVVYLVLGPLAGLAYAFIQANQPYVAAIGRVARGRLGPHAHPEVWDRAFNREIQPWVRVVFKNGTAIQGIARMAGLSPASRQILLVALPGVPESLVRLDEHGRIADDLTARAEGVWVEIGGEVLFVEIFG
jgi:uncharacterized protein DUF6338